MRGWSLLEAMVLVVFAVVLCGGTTTRLSDTLYRVDYPLSLARLCTVVSTTKVSCVLISEMVP